MACVTEPNYLNQYSEKNAEDANVHYLFSSKWEMKKLETKKTQNSAGANTRTSIGVKTEENGSVTETEIKKEETYVEAGEETKKKQIKTKRKGIKVQETEETHIENECERWGENEMETKRKTKKLEKIYIKKYSQFFVKAVRPNNMDEILKKTQEFVKNEKVILITSGGTKVPMEKAKVRNIQNFSTGRRGALMCEYFLKKNKKVIFLYCKDSALPFQHNLKSLLKLENVDYQKNNFVFSLKDEEHKSLFEALTNFKKFSKNLLLIPYETVFEYGYYLLELCGFLNKKEEIQKNKEPPVADIQRKTFHYREKRKLLLDDMLLFFTKCSNFPDIISLENESKKLLHKLNNFQNKYETYFSKEDTKILNLFTSISYLLQHSARNKEECLRRRSKQVISEIVAIFTELEKQTNEQLHVHETEFSIKKEKNKNTKLSTEFVLSSHIIILCAATSDFFIPFYQLNDKKVHSNKPLNLQLSIVPKFYKIIYKHFSLLKLCMFKLECNYEELIEKSRKRIKYADLLIANLLEQRYNYVIIFKRGNNKQLSILTKSKIEPVENKIGDFICKYFKCIPIS